MKVAYVTIKDAQSLGRDTEWSGTGYYISHSLTQKNVEIDYLGPLSENIPTRAVKKSKRLFYKHLKDKTYLKDTDPFVLKNFSSQVFKKLNHKKFDVVLSATVNPIAYLNCKLPIVFWADATFVNTAEFYPEYSNLCNETIRNGHLMEKLALEKCRFAVYSSEWAAKAAIEYYGVNPEKVNVISFGANLDKLLSFDEINAHVKARPKNKCKLIFIGKDWFRKGGNIAFQVTKVLNEKGLKTELTVVGCEPIDLHPIPDYIKPIGFISKFSKEGREKLANLIASSHFLILPTIADCSPIVLSEACSLGVPCISTRTGGIPSIVKDGVNGQLFSTESSIGNYADYILSLFANYSRYQSIALSSFEEYRLRLNWSTAGDSLKAVLQDALR